MYCKRVCFFFRFTSIFLVFGLRNGGNVLPGVMGRFERHARMLAVVSAGCCGGGEPGAILQRRGRARVLAHR